MSRPFTPSGSRAVGGDAAVGRQADHVLGEVDRLAPASSRRHWSTWSASNSESPIGWPRAARNVKHMPPPMARPSTTRSSASITPILSLTLAPPSTATNGRFGCWRRPSSTSTSRGQQPAGGGRQRARRPHDRGVGPVGGAEGVVDVGVLASTSRATNAGSFPSSPASKRRFSSRSTPGASSARRRRTGSIEYLGSGLPLGRPRWLHAVTCAPCSCSHVIVGSAARMRRSSVIRPSSSGTLKSARSSTRWPSSGSRSSSTGRSAPTSLLVGGPTRIGEVDEAVRVAPLVVVPAEHLDQVAVAIVSGVERARVRVPTMSDDTIGASVYSSTFSGPDSAAARKASLISSSVAASQHGRRSR